MDECGKIHGILFHYFPALSPRTVGTVALALRKAGTPGLEKIRQPVATSVRARRIFRLLIIVTNIKIMQMKRMMSTFVNSSWPAKAAGTGLLLCLTLCLQLSAFAQATGNWQGNIQYKNKYWKVQLLIEQAADTLHAFVDFVDVGGYRRKFSVRQQGDSLILTRPQPSGMPIIFAGKVSGGSFSGSWSGIGVQGATFALTPAQPPSYQTKSIEARNDSTVLKGNVLMPAGPGPFPAVIITHGGAAEDRMVWWGAAVHLAANGVAAVVYDKRGVGESAGGNWRNDGLQALTQDALALLQVLKTMKEINPKKIGVFGHSEGAWIAPMASVASGDVAFVVASGASVDNGSEQTIFHISNQLRDAGFSDTAIDKARQLWREVYAASRLCLTNRASKEKFEAVRRKLNAAAGEPWFSAGSLPNPYAGECPSAGMLHLLFFDPLATWRKVKAPAFLIWGEKDIVVPVEKGKKLVPLALQKAGNPNVTVQVEKGITHSITVAPGTEWDFPREAPGYFVKIARWINKQVSGI
jgi:pimeloyl-ACP methyl ester carboxylesterase